MMRILWMIILIIFSRNNNNAFRELIPMRMIIQELITKTQLPVYIA